MDIQCHSEMDNEVQWHPIAGSDRYGNPVASSGKQWQTYRQCKQTAVASESESWWMVQPRRCRCEGQASSGSCN